MVRKAASRLLLIYFGRGGGKPVMRVILPRTSSRRYGLVATCVVRC